LNIKVKVYENLDRDNSKFIAVKKTDTVRQLVELLKNEISEDFCPTGFKTADPENIRLRVYDPRMKVKL